MHFVIRFSGPRSLTGLHIGHPDSLSLGADVRVDAVQASSEPAEDEADGLHVDLAAANLSWYACRPRTSQHLLYRRSVRQFLLSYTKRVVMKLTPQCLSRRGASCTKPSSLAADFSELFKFGGACAAEPAPASSSQPSQQDTARDISSEAQPSAAAAAQPASETERMASPASSGSFSSSGFMKGPGIGVRPSGTSRLGGHAAADRGIGRRATKMGTPPSSGHGEGARFGRADISATSETKSGGADVRPRSSSAAASQRTGVTENDRARANQGSTSPAPVVKPVRAPETRPDREPAAGGNAPKQASTSPEDADMRDASPGQTKAEGMGSAADGSAPFGFTEAAMPAGVKPKASGASKAGAQAPQSQAEDDLAVQLAAAFRANMDRYLNPEELAEAVYDKVCFDQASKATAQTTPSQAEDDYTAKFAAKIDAIFDRHFSPEALEKTFKLHSDRAAQGGRKLHKGMNDGAVSSKSTELPNQSSDQKGHSLHESGSHSQAQAGESQKGADSGGLKANGFTLGSFSRLQKKKPPAAAATRARAATHGAKQEPAAEAGRGGSQAAGTVPDSTKASSLSDVWRIYAQELQNEKAAAAGATAARPWDSAGAQLFGSVPGSTKAPVGTASASARAENSSKSEAMGSAASFVTARSSPEVESLPDSMETLLKRWEAERESRKEQRDTREEDSLASKLRQQNLGESEDADTAASTSTGAAASETSTMPPAKQSEPPSVSFASAARGANFGLGQAPKAPRGIPRRSRGRARAAPSRPQRPPQPAGLATQPPPPVSEPIFFTSTPSRTPDQPSTTGRDAADQAAQGRQQCEPTTEQRPIFGFQPASGTAARQQGSQAKPEVHFGWPATEAAQGSSGAAPAQAQTRSSGPKHFSFKSPGSKVPAPSGSRSPQPSAFTWGQPPPAGVPFAKPPSPPQPASAAEASAGAPKADRAPSGTAAPPASFSAKAELHGTGAGHEKVQQESVATTRAKFAGVQPVRVAVLQSDEVPQTHGTASDAGTLLPLARKSAFSACHEHCCTGCASTHCQGILKGLPDIP